MPERVSWHLCRLQEYIVEMEEKIYFLEHMQCFDSSKVAVGSPGTKYLDLDFLLRYLANKVERQLGLSLEISNELSHDFEMDPSISLEMFSFLWRTCVLVSIHGKVIKVTLDVTADNDHIYLELVYFDADCRRLNKCAIYKRMEEMLNSGDAEVDIAWIGDQCYVTAAFPN